MSGSSPPFDPPAGGDGIAPDTHPACPFLSPGGLQEAAARADLCLAGDRQLALSPLQVALVCRGELQGDCPRFLGAVRRGRRAPMPPASATSGTPATARGAASEAVAEGPATPASAATTSSPLPSREVGAEGESAAETEVKAARVETARAREPRARAAKLRAAKLTAAKLRAANDLVVGFGSTLAELPRARVLALAVLLVAVLLAAVGSLRPGGLTIARLGLSPTATKIPEATPAPSEPPAPSPSPSVGVSPSSSPIPSPSPSPSLSPSPSASVAPSPTSDRYALLEPCPDRPDCYVYTVRQGDSLWGISRYFGVPLATIDELNPWVRTTGLRAGQKLVLPPPTR